MRAKIRAVAMRNSISAQWSPKDAEQLRLNGGTLDNLLIYQSLGRSLSCEYCSQIHRFHPGWQ
jgi:hypothetical protein